MAQGAADQAVAAAAVVKRVDFRTPGVECRGFLLGRGALVVGDVVHLAAERIDRVHAVTAFPGQQPHRPIERGSRRLDPPANRLAQRRLVGNGPDVVRVSFSVIAGGANTPVRNAAAKSPFDSLTRPASGSPRRSRRASLPASATMTADSQRNPRAATPGGRSRAVAISASVLSSSRSSTRRSAGLAAGAASASTVQPSAARSSSGR